MCRSSNCSMCIATESHSFHSELWQSFYSLDCLTELECNLPQLHIEDLYTSSAQITAASPPFITMLAHCCCSHSAVVRAWSIWPPPHWDSRPNFRFFLTCPALCGSLGCAFVIQYNGFNHRFFAQGRPAHAFGCPAMYKGQFQEFQNFLELHTFWIIFAKPCLMANTLMILALSTFHSLWLFPMSMRSFSPNCWSRWWASQDLVRLFTPRLLMNTPVTSFMTCAMHGMWFLNAGNWMREAWKVDCSLQVIE